MLTTLYVLIFTLGFLTLIGAYVLDRLQKGHEQEMAELLKGQDEGGKGES